jgi:SulP family sulfate permease
MVIVITGGIGSGKSEVCRILREMGFCAQYNADTRAKALYEEHPSLLAGIESLLSCVVSDGMIKDKHNSNTELIAQGLGNMCVGFFGGIPATGAIARTAANVRNGGRSPIAGMTHAIVLLLVLVVLIPYASLIPMPIIAAILFIVAYNMSEWREFVHIVKTSKWTDILVLVLTFALTVIFDLVKAIAVGMVVHYVIFFINKKINKNKSAE